MEEKKLITNPVKAIRAKCLDCSCGQVNEVALCVCKDCALYPFRFGKNPYRAKQEHNLSEEQIERRRKQMKAINEARKALSD